ANAFALADDIMEPFRPFVDMLVLQLIQQGIGEVDGEAKRRLATITSLDLTMGDGTVSPLGVAVQKMSQSLAASFENGRAGLDLPKGFAPARQPAEAEA